MSPRSPQAARDGLNPEEILEWLVYPDTGEFAP